ncbi:hypothetical protein HKD37_06G016675 [Glycine soja]
MGPRRFRNVSVTFSVRNLAKVSTVLRRSSFVLHRSSIFNGLPSLGADVWGANTFPVRKYNSRTFHLKVRRSRLFRFFRRFPQINVGGDSARIPFVEHASRESRVALPPKGKVSDLLDYSEPSSRAFLFENLLLLVVPTATICSSKGMIPLETIKRDITTLGIIAKSLVISMGTNQTGKRFYQVKVKSLDTTSIKELGRLMEPLQMQAFRKTYGKILELTIAEVSIEAIASLTQYYDQPLRCFTFADFQLVPTIEEFEEILGCPLGGRKPYLSSGCLPSLSRIATVVKDSARGLDRIKQTRNGIAGLPQKYLEDKARGMANQGDWVPFMDVLALLIFGVVLFPNVDGLVDLAAIDAFLAYHHSKESPVVAVLADLFDTFDRRCEKSSARIICCLPALCVWLVSHLFQQDTRHPCPLLSHRSCTEKRRIDWDQLLAGIGGRTISWFPRWKEGKEGVLFSCGRYPNIPLVGTRGCINYNPTLAIRQLGYPMRGAPAEESMSPFLVRDLGAQNSKTIQRIHKAWETPLRKDQELRGIRNGIIGGYHEWLKVRIRGLDWLAKLKVVSEENFEALEEDEEVQALKSELGKAKLAKEKFKLAATHVRKECAGLREENAITARALEQETKRARKEESKRSLSQRLRETETNMLAIIAKYQEELGLATAHEHRIADEYAQVYVEKEARGRVIDSLHQEATMWMDRFALTLNGSQELPRLLAKAKVMADTYSAPEEIHGLLGYCQHMIDLMAHIIRNHLLPSLIANHLAVITPGRVLEPPFPKWYDPNATCKYHGGVPGHSVEKCLALKYKVQHLMDAGWLTFQEDRPNVRTNPLANHGGGAVNAVESDRPHKSKPLRDVATPRRFIFEALQKGGVIPHSGCKEDSCLLHSGEMHDMETCLEVEELLQRMIDQGRLEVGIEGKEEQHICMQSTEGSGVAKPKPLVIYFTKSATSQKPGHPLMAKPVPFPYQNTVMMARVMLGNGFEPGMGLGKNNGDITSLINTQGNRGKYGLGYKPTKADMKRSIAGRKNNGQSSRWRQEGEGSPPCHISRSFISAGSGDKGQAFAICEDDIPSTLDLVRPCSPDFQLGNWRVEERPGIYATSIIFYQFKIKGLDVTSLKELGRLMGPLQRQAFRKVYEKILDLTAAEVFTEAVVSLAQYYDQPLRCSTFGDFQIVPTVEEFEEILGCPLGGRKPYIFSGFLPSLRKIAAVVGDSARELDRMKQTRNGVVGLPQKYLEGKVRDMASQEEWVPFAGILALLTFGVVLFPNVDGLVDLAAIDAFLAYHHSKESPVVAILADLFDTFDRRCEKSSARIFCCLPALSVWLVSHLFQQDIRHPCPLQSYRSCVEKRRVDWDQYLAGIGGGTINWFPRWKEGKEGVLFSCGDYPNVPLIGTRGCINYNPALAVRQLGYPMRGAPTEESLSPFLVRDFGPQSLKIVQKVHKAWKSPSRKDKELRGIRNGIISGYHDWLRVHTRGLDWLSKLKIINEENFEAPEEDEEVQALKLELGKARLTKEKFKSVATSIQKECAELREENAATAKALEQETKRARKEEYELDACSRSKRSLAQHLEPTERSMLAIIGQYKEELNQSLTHEQKLVEDFAQAYAEKEARGRVIDALHQEATMWMDRFALTLNGSQDLPRLLAKAKAIPEVCSAPEEIHGLINYCQHMIDLMAHIIRNPKWYNSNATCAYHSGAPGHNIDSCLPFKYKVQHLINVGWLSFQEEGPNVKTNPLASHGGVSVNAIEKDGPSGAKRLEDVATSDGHGVASESSSSDSVSSAASSSSSAASSSSSAASPSSMSLSESLLIRRSSSIFFSVVALMVASSTLHLLQRLMDWGQLEVSKGDREEPQICMQSKEKKVPPIPKALVICFTRNMTGSRPMYPPGSAQANVDSLGNANVVDIRGNPYKYGLGYEPGKPGRRNAPSRLRADRAWPDHDNVRGRGGGNRRGVSTRSAKFRMTMPSRFPSGELARDKPVGGLYR